MTHFHEDVLDGADQIAGFLFGDKKKRRRVYHLAERGLIPVFRLGQAICARKSALEAHVKQQERDALRPADEGK